MIDYENEIYTLVADSVKKDIEDVYITADELVRIPAHFPCVSIVEQDNYRYWKSMDGGSRENHARLIYEVNIYSNLQEGKRTQTKQIVKAVDDAFTSLGFVRMHKSPYVMSNVDLYRTMLRYECIISKNGVIYKR